MSNLASKRPSAARWLLAVIVAAAALYLLGNGRVDLWDRDEPRYAQSSRQMVQSGDWVVPRILTEPRTNKPPLIYWCQAAAITLLGDGPAAARLPSALAMILILAAVGLTVRRAVGPTRAFWTVLILSTTALTYWVAKTCLTDAVLTLFITVSQLCLYAIYRGNRSRNVTTTMWAAIGLAVLTKGPMVLGVLLTTMIALAAMDWALVVGARPEQRGLWTRVVRLGRCIWSGTGRAAVGWWPATRPATGLLLVALIVVPWLVAVNTIRPGFLAQMLLEFKHHASTGTEGHGGPPGFHLLTIWAGFFPWSLLLPTALTLGWKHRDLAPVRFALATVIGTWLLCECIPTKLPHYMFPAYAALSFLTADALIRCARGQHHDLTRPIMAWATAVWGLIVIALCLAPWLAEGTFSPLPTCSMIALSLLGVAWATGVCVLMCRQRLLATAAALGVGMMLFAGLFFGWFMPEAQFLRVPSRVAAILKQGGAQSVATMNDQGKIKGYDEDSLLYYAYHPGITYLRAEGVETLLTAPASLPRWIVIPEPLWSLIPSGERADFEEMGKIGGLDYASAMQVVNLVVVRRR